MDLWEYYDRVEKLIVALRDEGFSADADRVETAIRGGATSGEILGRLSLALPPVADSAPSFQAEVHDLAAWTKKALRPDR